MSAEMRSALRAWVQRALIAVGVACLVFYSVATVHTWRYQRAAKSEIERIASIERVQPVAAAARAPRPVKPLATGELIGKVEIPRLGLSAAVAEGDDDKTLRKAVGHLLLRRTGRASESRLSR